MTKFRFSKKAAMLLIEILVVAVALVLAVGTYTWFASQTQVDVTTTTVTAAAASNTTLLEIEEEENDDYSGQTGTGFLGGNDELDVPYTRKVTVSAKFEPTTEEAYLSLKLKSMIITRARHSADVPPEQASSEDTPEILEYFTWRARARVVTSEPDAAVKEYGEWVALRPETYTEEVEEPDGEGGTNVVEIIHNTGFACTEDNERYAVTSDTETQIEFTLIFLDEQSYRARENNSGSIKEFAYCGPENMKAVFSCVIELGFNI